MGRICGSGSVRKGLAIAGLLVAWSLTIGSEPAKAQQQVCTVSDSTIVCTPVTTPSPTPSPTPRPTPSPTPRARPAATPTVIPTGQCTTNPDGSFTCTGFAPNGAASASCSSAGTCTLTCNGATASNVPIASVVSAAPGLCGVGAVRSV